MRKAILFVLPLGFAVFLISGCANYASRIREPRNLFEMEHYGVAADELQKLADRHDNDELLYLMDLGIVQHTAGLYPEAIQTFLKADKLAEVSDYTSISQEAGSILFSDDTKVYKGQDFEKILINVYLAMDYTLSHHWDDALVECRRVNHKLDMMISQGKRPYEHNAFAKYLSAVLFDARKEYNDAFVDYRQFLKWDPGFPYLPAPLLRVADRLGDEEELDEYRKIFPGVKHYRLRKNEGEIVLLLEQGRSPIKVENPQYRLLPMFISRNYYSDYVSIRVDDGDTARTYPLFDIEHTAIKELEHETGGIIAKKMVGTAVKVGAGYAVEKLTNSEFAGVLTSLLLLSSDHADLRSWTTLPARLQLARFSVPAGRHQLVLDMVSRYGTEMKGVKRWDAIDVKPGETVFLNYRTRD